jgi:hypothetical protein
MLHRRVFYNGKRVVIDGNTRVNKWVNEGSMQPRSGLLIEPKPFTSGTMEGMKIDEYHNAHKIVLKPGQQDNKRWALPVCDCEILAD